ncbi:MAG: FKBP-type peptidyl-prolyl cis-trans isomerase [Bacteroidales bacterium]
MKMKKMVLLIATAAVIFSACSNNSIKSAKIETKEDSLAYAFGVNTYFAMKQDNFEIDPALMAKGMLDSKESKNVMDEMYARGFIVTYIQEKQQSEMMEMYQDVIKENETFLEENKKRDGVITTESGLQYEVITKGTGPKPTADDIIRTHYKGELTNGEVFDSSIESGQPLEIAVGSVIPGWVEGLQLMPVGSKYKFFIPYNLGYGEQGAGGVIPPYATLVFEVELLEILEK